MSFIRFEFLVTLLLLLCSLSCAAEPANVFEGDDEFPLFDDQPLSEALEFPDWFKLSFLDLQDDIAEAREEGKAGIIVYFGQKYCAYCKQFLEKDLDREDIQAYLRQHFDIIGIDIHGQRQVVDPAGNEYDEAEYAVHEKTNFTPSLIFYDIDGHEVLRLRGYYPPYRFRAALEYVADRHYRIERYRDFLARAGVPLVFEPGELSDEDFFIPGPYMLDRSRFPAERPLAVFFEQGNCHACDVLHTGPLADPEIRALVEQLESVQLSLWDDTPVVTPTGEHTTARRWADKLGLFYTPTLMIFAPNGDEIIRVDSVVQFYRLRNILEYVLSEGYRDYPTFQRWRQSRWSRIYK
jgi:thioredoxin-related protein